MDLPTHIKPFWFEYLSEADHDPGTPVFDIFHFDDNKSDANELADLVLRGKSGPLHLCSVNTRRAASDRPRLET